MGDNERLFAMKHQSWAQLRFRFQLDSNLGPSDPSWEHYPLDYPGASFKLETSQCMTKPTKWPVCPAKPQISLGICPVWSESLQYAWRKLGSLATHISTQWIVWSGWVNAQADMSLCWAHMPFWWVCHALAQMCVCKTLCSVCMFVPSKCLSWKGT